MKDIGKYFLEYTKYKYIYQFDESKRSQQPPLELKYDITKELISLPDPHSGNFGSIPLEKAITERKSLRKFASTPLSREELSYLLWSTQGVKKVVDTRATFRTVPSAGARHAFETYLLINNVDGLEPGLYRYLALQNKLIEVDLSSDIKDKIVAGCLGQGFAGLSAVTFIWVAVPFRMTWRYGQRGYRYLFLDAGHVCQNLYLAAESIGAGACALAAFDDEVINDVLGLDGENSFVIYVAPVGKK
jgi:SagB-type dehydrogenase family enzyme